MMKEKVGVCDADPAMLRLLLQILKREGYEGVNVGSHGSVMRIMEELKPHAFLLDNLSLCQDIRRYWPGIPVIILSTETEERQIVRALDLGADDYVIKPFGSEELLARLRALLRRAHTDGNGPLSLLEPKMLISKDGKISMDGASHIVRVEDKKVQLTPKEFELLWQLMLNEGKVLTFRMLLHRVWGPEYGEEVDYLRVFVRQLRCKIEREPSHPHYLLTEARIGYRFQTPSS